MFAGIKKRLSILRYISFSKEIKLNIGAGKFGFENGWFLSDIDTLNILSKESWNKNLQSKKAKNIMAEHVWEHLSYEDGLKGAKNCFAFLGKGGRLRIAVPDGFHPNAEYIEYVKPGGTGAGADDHKILYNYTIITTMLEKAGFLVELLEYWDEVGKFHYMEWDINNGYIMRSKNHDLRNKSGELKYTSLIVDAIKND